MSGGRDGHASESVRLVELIQRVASGDETALTMLYDETSSRVFGTALQMLRSPHLAAGVTQEVYVEIWQQASCYDPNRGSVLAWMMAVVHGHCKHVRAINTGPVAERYVAVNGEREFDRGSVEMRESRLDADRALEALGSLPDIQRQAVTLAYFKGYSQIEVARLLDLPLGTVKSGIRDGLIGLRHALGVGT